MVLNVDLRYINSILFVLFVQLGKGHVKAGGDGIIC